MKSPLDIFFSLGGKVTKNDPVKKAQFDYYLYWIIFLAFSFIALQYYYNFFIHKAAYSTLMWAIIISVFCWFNYYSLGGMRSIYESMKQMKEATQIKVEDEDSVDEMLEEFK